MVLASGASGQVRSVSEWGVMRILFGITLAGVTVWLFAYAVLATLLLVGMVIDAVRNGRKRG